MKASLVYSIAAVLYLFFGLASVLVPDTLANAYGISLDGMAINLLRFAGLTLLGLAILAWLARNEAETRLGQAVTLSFLVLVALQGAWFLVNVLNNTVGSVGWVSVVLYALLVAGFAYVYFVKPAAASVRTA